MGIINFRFLFSLALLVIVATVAFYGIFKIKNEFFSNKQTISEEIVLTKITTMGKLELVKFSMKDVIDKTESKDFSFI